jgi:hypothetical protein
VEHVVSNRFRRFGNKVNLDEVIKDCRELDALLATQTKLIEKMNEELVALRARIEVLEGGP